MPIKIFIDQGHNPVNPNAGAEYAGVREQDVTYDVGIRLAGLLRADPAFSVRTSRSDPEQVLGSTNAQSLALRVSAANDWGADYFLSLHTNAAENESAEGAEAFVYSMRGEAAVFAERILIEYCAATGMRDRGVFARPGLYVLRRTAMPAALVETGFISNRYDRAILTEQPDLCARGLYAGIMKYFGF